MHHLIRSVGRTSFSRALLRAVAALLLLGILAQTAAAAKNVIVMISDGAGFNTWAAASMYRGKLGEEVYDAEGWVRIPCSTHPLNVVKEPTGEGVQDPKVVYSPRAAWDASPAPKVLFVGYDYLRRTATDSAAAGTALASGVKTYNNAINWTDLDEPLRGQTLSELAKKAGKSVGVVTTVQISHATPACLGGAHNVDRGNYAAIAKEMLSARHLDVLMGAGHPEFGDDGRPPKTVKKYDFVGGKTIWEQLRSGKHPRKWTLVETKADFEALVSGPTPPKVLGIAQAGTTLQQRRPRPGDPEKEAAPAAAPAMTAPASTDAKDAAAPATPPAAATPPVKVPPPDPFAVPMNSHVPSLETMVRAALNCLDDNPKGFYLGVEGGAVDWANHANQPERMIEEQIDFLKAVEAVVEWVETHSRWDETLVIVTTDHECGMVWGPDSDTVPFAPIVDRGAGQLPGIQHNSRSHTNSLVPLWARGPGSEQFASLTVGSDPKAEAAWGFGSRYAENTSVFVVAQTAIAQPVRPAEQPAASAATEP